MSDKEMTLQERFDWHMGEALHWDEMAALEMNRHEARLQTKRAQLHATLALAIAQRMTAEATGKSEAQP